MSVGTESFNTPLQLICEHMTAYLPTGDTHRLSPDFLSFPIILDPVTLLQLLSPYHLHKLSPYPTASTAWIQRHGLGHHFHNQLGPQMLVTHPFRLP